MNNPTENFEPTGYHDDEHSGSLGRTGLHDDPAPPQKKKSIVFPLVLGSIVLVGGTLAYFMFLKPQPRPQNAPQQQQQTKPLDSQNSAPPAQSGSDATNKDSFGDTGTPPVSPPAATVDPLTGLAGQPSPSQSSVPQTNPTGNAPTGLDPITGLPAQSAAPAAPSAPSSGSEIDPLTGLPVQQQPSQGGLPQNTALQTGAGALDGGMLDAPTVQQNPPSNVNPLDTAPTQQPTSVPAQTSVTSDPLAQFKDMLAPIDGRVTTLEGKVGRLETSVDGLSKKIDALGVKRPVAVRASVKKKVVRERPRTNSIQLEHSYRVAPPVSRVIIDDGRGLPQTSDGVTVERPQSGDTIRVGAPTCTIQAITAGRAWTRRPDGSFVSYAEGDTWVNGQQIETIDPQKGIRAGGRWICM